MARKPKAKFTRAEVAALLHKYATHDFGCAANRSFERECDCGLYDLRGPRPDQQKER